MYARALAVTAVVLGVSAALRYFWTCDDAYIVFQYARNLVRGAGLVFNPGERVEGFTDFLWVLWTAPAFVLKVDPELWTNVWSVLCYAGTILLLAFEHDRVRRTLAAPPWAVVPVAALAAASHAELATYATSGLETSLFTFLLVAGYVVLVGRRLTEPGGGRAAALGGLLFGLASLTRPDGVLPAAVAGAFVLLRTRSVRRAAAYAGAAAALMVPLAVFRAVYYGSLVPNTYWAKSANLPWWGQGLRYLGLYLEKYGAQTLALVLVPIAVAGMQRGLGARREAVVSEWTPRVLFAGALAGTYVLYVTRVGGDFMYARLLLPAVPFALLLVDLGWTALPARTPALVAALLAAAVCAAPAFFERPFLDRTFEFGVSDEWAFYSLKKNAHTDFRADVVKPFMKGLPVRMLIFGAEVRFAYRIDPPLAVEGHGLTDAAIAHAPLAEHRGRPGHERLPSPAYAVLERKLHITFHPRFYEASGLKDYLPFIPIRFGSVVGVLLHWDPVMMAEWKRRGAEFPDVPALLDEYIATMDSLPDEKVRKLYPQLQHFYFAHVNDPAREAPFRRRLGLP